MHCCMLGDRVLGANELWDVMLLMMPDLRNAAENVSGKIWYRMDYDSELSDARNRKL